ncbi:hypothetical protein [Nocardia sp. alder85J]|uniref:hypothetical protein n=1 Tax=Nocardia sp. alder85J TaxID=2862949 RepID=UPI001CD6C4A4|nr:hypothetical protein [Nocardia sp. alder85J]MCX4094634.1 hypothetical protein [Nocardia sp. alder85J]
MPLPRLKLSALGKRVKIATGGQGSVSTAPNAHMQFAKTLVYKEYKPDKLVDVDVAVLESMPAHLESLPFGAGTELLSLVAWPCRLVEDDATGAVLGFVMPSIPDRFFVDMMKSSGPARVLGEFQHLLNDDSFIARRGIPLTDRHRYELLGETARALTVLHRHGVVVGDLSPKNMLFSLSPTRAVYFIDCDAMRLHGRSALPQLETPGWEVRVVDPAEELATVASDSYKFGLLALRLLTGDQTTRDPARLPPTVPAPVRDLVRSALVKDPAARPVAADWVRQLAQAAAAASTRPVGPTAAATPATGQRTGSAPLFSPVHGTGTPPQSGGGTGSLPQFGTAPGGYSASRAARRSWWGSMPIAVKSVGGGVLAFLALVWILHSVSGGGGDRATPGGNALAPNNSAAGELRVIGTDRVGHSPWGVVVDADNRTAFVTDADDDTITAIDTGTGAQSTLPAAAKPTAITLDQARHLAYVTNAVARSVSVIDTRTRQFVANIAVGAAPYGIALDAGGRTAYVSNFDDDTVSIIDTNNRFVTATVHVGAHPYGIAVDRSTGSVYVAAARDNTVSVIDPTSATVATVIPVGQEPWGVAVDSGTAYVTNHQSGTVSVIDTAKRVVATTISVGSGPVGVAFAPGGHTVYVTDHSVDTVSIIDTAARRVTDTVRVGDNPHGVGFDRATGAAYITDFTVGTVSIIGR